MIAATLAHTASPFTWLVSDNTRLTCPECLSAPRQEHSNDSWTETPIRVSVCLAAKRAPVGHRTVD